MKYLIILDVQAFSVVLLLEYSVWKNSIANTFNAFSRIRQVAPVCTLGPGNASHDGAQWCHLANTMDESVRSCCKTAEPSKSHADAIGCRLVRPK